MNPKVSKYAFCSPLSMPIALLLTSWNTASALQERVQPAEVAEHQELRDQRDVVRQHHRPQDDDEQRVAQRKAQAGEGVGGQRRAEEAPRLDPDRDDHRG